MKKKVITIVLILFPLTVMALMFGELRQQKDQGRLALQDHFGDRAVLTGIDISGELRDGYHRTRFTLHNGEIKRETLLTAQPESYDVRRFAARNSMSYLDMDYEVFPYVPDYEIRSYRWNGSYREFGDTALFTSPLQYRGAISEGVTFANDPLYGVTRVGDEVYYTLPASDQFYGNSPIYHIKFGHGPYSTYPDEHTEPMSEEIANIDLSANQTAEGQKLEVLGLEGVGDRLVAVTSVDGRLHLNGYGTDGSQLGTLMLPNMRVGRFEQQAETDIRVASDYLVFVDQAQQQLILVFRHIAEGQLRFTALTVKASAKLELLDRTEVTLAEGQLPQDNAVFIFGYQAGRLYTVMSVQPPYDPAAAQIQYHFEMLYPHVLYIDVYERGERIYRGELQSDRNEDNLHAAYHSEASFGYGKHLYRNFVNLAIRPSDQEGSQHD